MTPARPGRRHPYWPLSRWGRREIEWAEIGLIPILFPETGGNGDTSRNCPIAKHLVTPTALHEVTSGKSESLFHTIFEDTSEIQQLVIARAISGLRIE